MVYPKRRLSGYKRINCSGGGRVWLKAQDCGSCIHGFKSRPSPQERLKMKKFIKIFLSLLIGILFAFTTSNAAEIDQNVFNQNGYPIGFVDTDGNVLNRLGRSLGSVNQSGEVFNRFEKKIGSIDLKGNLYAPTGLKIGKVNRRGRAFNRNGYPIGFVKTNGNIYLIGGAAIIINLKSPRNWKERYR
jgi:hypothetical protein